MTEKQREFDKLVWIFTLCSFIGLICEGTYTYLHTGHWENHVITMILPICPIYGVGALVFYTASHKISDKVNIFIKALLIGTCATAMEFLCGLFLRYALGMRAWDYTEIPTNVLGIFCPEFLVIWSVFGLIYLLVVKQITKRREARLKENKQPKTGNKAFHIFTVIFSIFLFLDMLSAWVLIFFWSDRHYGDPIDTKAEITAVQIADDSDMQNRFVEWHFLDDLGEIPKGQRR
ncbi:MAG: putative ABC transporter permease [Clostridia bacterium]|nr:putative ABC transporter permease [Clostridia bacterium]